MGKGVQQTDKKSPLISVVTVVYNNEATLERTIQSVLKQTYVNVEYIIIDGNSTDHTVDIIRKYADKLAFWMSEPDKGVYDAMNKGIEHAEGEWICFMNSGDCFHHMSVLEEIFSAESYDEQVGVIYGDAHLYDGETFVEPFKNTPFFESCMPYRTGKGICHQSMFTRTSLAKKMKFDLSYKISADFDMAYKIYKQRYLYTHVPVVVCNFDINGMSSVSTGWKNTYRETGRLLGCEHNLFYLLFYYVKWLRKLVQ